MKASYLMYYGLSSRNMRYFKTKGLKIVVKKWLMTGLHLRPTRNEKLKAYLKLCLIGGSKGTD